MDQQGALRQIAEEMARIGSALVNLVKTAQAQLEAMTAFAAEFQRASNPQIVVNGRESEPVPREENGPISAFFWDAERGVKLGVGIVERPLRVGDTIELGFDESRPWWTVVELKPGNRYAVRPLTGEEAENLKRIREHQLREIEREREESDGQS